MKLPYDQVFRPTNHISVQPSKSERLNSLGRTEIVLIRPLDEEVPRSFFLPEHHFPQVIIPAYRPSAKNNMEVVVTHLSDHTRVHLRGEVLSEMGVGYDVKFPIDFVFELPPTDGFQLWVSCGDQAIEIGRG